MSIVPAPSPAAPPEGLLWHYTNTGGLLGILREKCLWATDALFLNDSREIRAAMEPFAEFLQEKAAKTLEPGEVAVEKLHAIYVGNRAESLEPSEGVFITSFSGAEDLLSQWRGYGTGGFALGFEISQLHDWAIKQGASLEEVIYDSPDKDALEGFPSAGMRVDRRNIGYLYMDAMAVLARYKDPAFREEREWRVVATEDSGELEFRDGHRGLTPYVKVHLDLSLIRHVINGPGNTEPKQLRATERLLGKYGVRAGVSPSDVPFLP